MQNDEQNPRTLLIVMYYKQPKEGIVIAITTFSSFHTQTLTVQ